MNVQLQNHKKKTTLLALSLKTTSISIFLLLCVLIAACSGNTANTPSANQEGPVPTLTINLGGKNLSPTPTLPPFTCGAWVTQPSVNAKKAEVVGVNAKFVRFENSNPIGVEGATATAVVTWPAPGGVEQYTETTTADGLVVFEIPMKDRDYATNKLVTVAVTFNKPDVGTCTVDQSRGAFFTPIIVTPTPKPKKTPKNNDNNNN